MLVSGPIGEHGITVMLARGGLELDADLVSDTAPVAGLVAGLLDAVPGVRAMRALRSDSEWPMISSGRATFFSMVRQGNSAGAWNT